MAKRQPEIAFGVLGPLEVATHAVGASAPDAASSWLPCWSANAVVSADHLIQALWGDSPRQGIELGQKLCTVCVRCSARPTT
jgi:DNA-binding SARP family transcriptional activator